ncbi:MAG: DUF4062 domain-containing protein [Azospirillaceae bacterium]|nr:DUF4062 domain-containing protein [Azospirillaceae bacterium]
MTLIHRWLTIVGGRPVGVIAIQENNSRSPNNRNRCKIRLFAYPPAPTANMEPLRVAPVLGGWRIMPKQLTQYRIFIASPSGLDAERKCFQSTLQRFTIKRSEPRKVLFHPVMWEQTIGGVGRPQALINEDLKQCDYAVFVLHDRWGSSLGGPYTSGFEEEFALTEELYKANKIRNIALFFKAVGPRQMRDPGPQLMAVLFFKKRIEEEKIYLFNSYDGIDQFAETLEEYLESWLRNHENLASGTSADGLVSNAVATVAGAGTALAVALPGFAYWIAEANGLLKADPPDHAGAAFCAAKAIDAAGSDLEWAESRTLLAYVQYSIGKLDEAFIGFASIAERFVRATDIVRSTYCLVSLVNTGGTLHALGRSAEAIAAYDDLLSRFGSASEEPLRGVIAKARSFRDHLRES